MRVEILKHHKPIYIKGFAIVPTDSNPETSNCPYLICQLCDKIIKRNENIKNVAVWATSTSETNKQTFKPMTGIIAHKTCMERLKDNEDKYPAFWEIESFMFDMLWNSDIKPKKADYY